MNDSDRNKRLFGSLMGHLQKAKKQSADDGDRLAKRKAMTQIVVDKDHRRALLAQRDVVREKAEHFVAKEEKMGKYLVTNTKPEIFWIPSIKSETMERLYESRKRDLEERLRHREEEDAGALRSIDQKVLAIEERIKGYGGDVSTKDRGDDK